MRDDYLSWGRTFRFEHEVWRPRWLGELPKIDQLQRPFLPRGMGRSYGDVGLLDKGMLIDMTLLNRMQNFDPRLGIIRCEAGSTIEDLLRIVVPAGWFVPVVPGTKFVTVGGAIANDIHGKNHHREGSFGRFVRSFELLKSNGSKVMCSAEENSDLFAATIGGMGLTGLITWAEISLKKIVNRFIEQKVTKFKNMDGFFKLADTTSEYTMAWIDSQAVGTQLGRGHFIEGKHHLDATLVEDSTTKRKISFSIPGDAPNFLLGEMSIKSFNSIYYARLRQDVTESLVDYNPFFFPLDSVLDWNRLYGRRGFFQFQFVVPLDGSDVMTRILGDVARSGQGSFLTVLKKFGSNPSPGMMSFPQEGFTLTLDFANNGEQTVRQIHRYEELVCGAGGRLYAAKDALMSPETYRRSYPRFAEFHKHIDPAITSSFWQRVTK